MTSNDVGSQQGHALIIGIDEYPMLPGHDLNGCVNDAELMRDILQRNFGFPAANITLLRNSEASRAGILAAMDALVERVQHNDRAVFYYAGHGSQMTDRVGNQPTGLNETLVSADSGRGSDPNRDIIDDEVHVFLGKLSHKTSYITFLFDCCHSGSIGRRLDGPVSRSLPADRRPVSQLPPYPLPAGTRALEGATGPSGWLPLSDSYVLIAACRDNETAFEYPVPAGSGADAGEPVSHGALTFFLSTELAKATSGMTYRDVFERASSQVTVYKANQHPQLEGQIDRELFGVRQISPVSSVSVIARSGDTATLNAGAAHGLTVGSRWEVFKQGTKLEEVHSEHPARLGLVELTTVGSIAASGRVVEEAAAAAIQVGAHAVEKEHNFGAMRFPVAVVVSTGNPSDAAAVSELIGKSDVLRMVKDGEPAACSVYLLPARATAGQGDPAPQLGALLEPTYVLLGPDGHVLAPPHAASERDIAQLVRDNLEVWAHYRHGLALDNPNSQLRGKVSLSLLRKASEDNWVPAVAPAAGGQVKFPNGEAIAFEIQNSHTQPLYISILDFGLDGSISLLYPPPGAREALAPGRSFRYGVLPEDAKCFGLPPGYGGSPDGNGQSYAGNDVEVVKLFATTQEIDFGALLQSGARSIDLDSSGAGSVIEQLLGQALAGKRSRNIYPVATAPASARRAGAAADDWTTVTRSFILEEAP